MRFNPDFPPDNPPPVPIDRAVTLLMPAGFCDQLVSDLSAANSAAAALSGRGPDRAPDRGPSLGARLLGFLLRPNLPGDPAFR